MADFENRDQGRGNDEEEDEEEIDDTGYKMTKDAVLFCIDVSESMMEQPVNSGDKKADTDSPTLAALKCAYQLMQQRIISNPNDMMGVLLFGTEQSRFQGDNEEERSKIAYPHCYLLTDLDVPAAADVKALRTLVEDEAEAAQLLVPSKEPAAMSTVLFCANQIFTTKAANFSSRRLFLVTDNDNPHSNEKELRNASAVRAKDLYDLGVVIELFPIATADQGFDRTKFYDDIVYRQMPGDENAPAPLSQAAKTSASGGGISLLQSLISNINSKAAARRAVFTLPMEIGPGLKIGIKGYTTLKRQEAMRSTFIWLGGEKPQIAVGSTTKMAEDTAREVEKLEIRKAFKFGGETVSFTDEELKKIKTFGEPGLRVIGFKDMSLLPTWASTKPATFIYPYDVDYIGSTRTFSALYQQLWKKKKFALVWFIARSNAEPRLAAAVPSDEKYNEDGEQITPQGLWLVHLPFADDIRKTPDVGLLPAPDPLVDRMRKWVLRCFICFHRKWCKICRVVNSLRFGKGETKNVLVSSLLVYGGFSPSLILLLLTYPALFSPSLTTATLSLNLPRLVSQANSRCRVVQQLQLPKGRYDPKKYPNPALQWFYRILQAIALEEEIPETPEDKTLPRYRQIDKRAGQMVVDWGVELEDYYARYQQEHGGHGSIAAVGSKRTADGTVDGPKPKRAKKDDAGGDGPTEADMRDRWEKGDLEKLTVAVLKGFLSHKKLSSTGKKADLLDRINEYFETK